MFPTTDYHVPFSRVCAGPLTSKLKLHQISSLLASDSLACNGSHTFKAHIYKFSRPKDSGPLHVTSHTAY